MKNADMPAIPMQEVDQIEYGMQCRPMRGLTKREEAAFRMMQGIITGVLSNGVDVTWSEAARDSIYAADAILAELERTS